MLSRGEWDRFWKFHSCEFHKYLFGFWIISVLVIAKDFEIGDWTNIPEIRLSQYPIMNETKTVHMKF